MENVLAFEPVTRHDVHTLPLIRIRREVAQKKSSHPCFETVLNPPACRTLRLEYEIVKLKQDLDVEKRRSLGFEQDLKHIIEQVMRPMNL